MGASGGGMSGPFWLQDNGLRCLVEPCPSWDVLDAAGQVVDRVSRIEGADGRFLALADVDTQRSYRGAILPYEVDTLPNRGDVAKRFVITGDGD